MEGGFSGCLMHPAVPCLVLAAGYSRRWGAADKLLHPWEGVPVLRRTVEALQEGGLGPLVIVTREERQSALAGALGGLRDLVWVFNRRAEGGLGTSVAAGARHLRGLPGLAGVAVCPADLPTLQPVDVATVLAAFSHDPGEPVRAFHGETPGHPVIFPSSWLEALAQLAGEAGARELLRGAACRRAPGAGPGVCRDLDQRATASEADDV